MIKIYHSFILFVRATANFVTLPVPSKIQKARDIVTKMTGNPNFVTPEPKLADVTLAIDDLEVKYEAALNRDTFKKQEMYVAEKLLNEMISNLCGYVQTTSAGDNIKILSSGFDAKKAPTPPEPLPAPENLKGTTGTLPGTIDFKWKRDPKAHSYNFEYTTDPLGSTPWIKLDSVTKSKITVTGLESGKLYWGRVSASNPAGVTNTSDPSIARAL